MIVADANLVLYLLIPGARTAEAEAVYRRDPAWMVPPLCLSEVRNVVLRYVRAAALSLADAERVVARAEGLLTITPIAVNSATVLLLGHQSGCSAYDCEYVALAEELGVPLVTSDQALRHAFGPSTRTPEEFLGS